MKCLTNKWREGAMLLSFLLISCLAGIFTACDDIEDEYITDTQLSILQENRASFIEEFNLRNCSRDIS